VSVKKELESKICEIEKALKDHEVILRQKELALKYAHEDMEEKRGEWALHDNNMRFMKNKAEIVDIKEFAGVRDLRKQSRDAYEAMMIKAHGLQSEVTFYGGLVSNAKKEIARIKEVLAGYGTVIQFPGGPHE
jgi:hypothetical protein